MLGKTWDLTPGSTHAITLAIAPHFLSASRHMSCQIQVQSMQNPTLLYPTLPHTSQCTCRPTQINALSHVAGLQQSSLAVPWWSSRTTGRRCQLAPAQGPSFSGRNWTTMLRGFLLVSLPCLPAEVYLNVGSHTAFSHHTGSRHTRFCLFSDKTVLHLASKSYPLPPPPPPIPIPLNSVQNPKTPFTDFQTC